MESKIGDLLTSRGYELSGLPRINVSPIEDRFLRLQTRYARTRHRIEWFGPRLWIESIIANRIGPKAWRDSVAGRINEIINTHLD